MKNNESKIQEFIGTLGKINYYEEGGILYLNAEQIARGLGFVETKIKRSLKNVDKNVDKFGEYPTYIMWNRINKYLINMGYEIEIKKGDYIPENIFYRLAMKANNHQAQEFQSWIADEVLPSIRKTGIYIDKDHDKIRSFGINVRLVEARAIKHLLVYAKENYNIELNRDENYGKLSCYANRISDMKQDARDEADSINLAICLTIESCIAVTINTLISLNIHPLDITKMTMHTLNKFVSKIKDESKKRKDKKKHKISVTEVSNSIVLDYTKLARKHIFDNIEVA